MGAWYCAGGGAEYCIWYVDTGTGAGGGAVYPVGGPGVYVGCTGGGGGGMAGPILM